MRSESRKIISDVIVTPKREITSQIFRAPEPTIKHKTKSTGGRLKTAALSILILLVLFFGWGALFAKMELRAAPKRNMLNILKTITLSQNPQGEELFFKNFTIPYKKNGNFHATNKSSTASKAEGMVVLFNKGKDAQVLIASTRLESASGKIYRIPKTIAVPFSRTDGGKLVPGSLETRAIADKPGSDYNSNLTDFTVPGLNGSPKFNLIFGRSKTAMTGGSSGEKLLVGKSDQESASVKLIGEAKEAMPKIALGKIPQSEYLLQTSLEYVSTKETLEPKLGETATSFNINIEGEIRGVTVSREDLEKNLLKNQLQAGAFSANQIKIKNLDELPAKIIGYKFGATNFKLEISGKAEAESEVDAESIKNSIIEKKLYEPAAILANTSTLSRAEIKFKPFWIRFFKSYFVTAPNRIDVILE